ncbi:FAD-dependent oxidoreductase [Cryobacterium sp.]|jgi:assimilatory nitrate reductase electron transfer subunit|uniref:FAD-dependent oxidoreductase n=1 Tax=Cryobacterium sp. TaxID=1926290 RepID=UPI002617C787|nr:FAD-dependent oxidoreductase [Cryobacterium sp.]MCU1446869.1 FAD/NAD(P)-binding oxidoreductase [Cryobacterium sp.]
MPDHTSARIPGAAGRAAPERIVVVGYGPVGSRFVDELLPLVEAGLADLTVVGAEQEHAYNRVLLADYAVGRTDRDTLDLTDGSRAPAAGARVLTGTNVTSVNRTIRTVSLSDGSSLPYDRLVPATGARANVPTLDGVKRVRRGLMKPGADAAALDSAEAPLPRGVSALRDLADAAIVLAAVQAGQRIVVLGAGMLGMEIALAASAAGAQICVVYHGEIPMNRNLDRGAGSVLTRSARRAGVSMVNHARAESVLFSHDDDGVERFEALICADGKQISGDLLLLSCGVGARTELAHLAGLPVSTGILVDESLRSWADSAISAIGDCAHVAARPADADLGAAWNGARMAPAGGPSGLIGPGWRQADRLAARFTAEITAGSRVGRGSGLTAAIAPQGTVLPTTARPSTARPSTAVPSTAVPATAGPVTSVPSAAAPEPAPVLAAGPAASVVMLKAEGIDVVAAGDTSADPFDAALAETDAHAHGCGAGDPAPLSVSQWADPEHGRYVKMITRAGILTAFVCVGMPRTGAELTLLYERGSELPADRSVLLRFDGPDYDPATAGDAFAPDATVCWCNGVTVEAITTSAQAGNDTVACIGSATRAGTGCGGCKGRIGEVLERFAAQGVA